MQELCQIVSQRAGFIIQPMTSLVIFSDSLKGAALLAGELSGAGMSVVQSVSVLADLARVVQQHPSDVLVCHVAHADAEFFDVTRSLAAATPCAVLVLTDSSDVPSAAASVDAGVHAYCPGYVLGGTSAECLPALVQLALARCKRDAALAQALADAAQLLEERKVVDHAKTILMRARDLSDDDAFRMLRTASMHSNQRMAEVSGHIIQAARFADGVNRAGQLRMLSQRLVKLQAMLLLRPDAAPKAALKDAVKRIDDNLKLLAQNFAQPELAMLVKQAGLTWAALKRTFKKQTSAQDMGAIDGLAEALLVQAEHLTSQLQNAGVAMPLQVLNMAGRQRMLTQRFAKFALLRALGKASDSAGDDAAMLESRQSFEKAQHYLNNIPLNTPEIAQLLASAKLGWRRLLAGAEQVGTAAGLAEIESASEALLAVFEQLSATYESSMQMLMG